MKPYNSFVLDSFMLTKNKTLPDINDKMRDLVAFIELRLKYTCNKILPV